MLLKIFVAIIFAAATVSAAFDVFRPNNHPDDRIRDPGNRPGPNPASNFIRNPAVVAKKPGFEPPNLPNFGNSSSARTKVTTFMKLIESFKAPGYEPTTGCSAMAASARSQGIKSSRQV